MTAQYHIESQHVQTTAPTALPVDVSDLKVYLGVDHDEHDSRLLDPLVAAAVSYVETYTQRQLMDATWTLRLDHFPDVIELRRPPVSSVTSVSYIDTAGSSQTLTAVTDYRVDTTSYPGRITPAYGKTWPSTYDVTNAVTVVYQAGATSPGNVPHQAVQAIRGLVQAWYCAEGEGVKAPQWVDMLLDQVCWTAA